jgi:hypothetical protein
MTNEVWRQQQHACNGSAGSRTCLLALPAANKQAEVQTPDFRKQFNLCRSAPTCTLWLRQPPRPSRTACAANQQNRNKQTCGGHQICAGNQICAGKSTCTRWVSRQPPRPSRTACAANQQNSNKQTCGGHQICAGESGCRQTNMHAVAQQAAT